jgi:hypothetical protein
MEVVTKVADSGKAVDIVYLVFAKAFDKVPIKRLTTKLAAAGIRGNVLKWITDWLTDRRQRVIVNGKFSGWRKVLSGRVGKNPGFFKKTQPGWVFWVLLGFFGFYWFF